MIVDFPEIPIRYEVKVKMNNNFFAYALIVSSIFIWFFAFIFN